MKKYILLLIPLIVSISGCKKSSTPSKEVVNNFKALLAKQDTSDYYQKWFASVYTQEYSIVDIENHTHEYSPFDDLDDDEGKITNFFNYAGYGFLDYYYILSENNYNALMNDYGEINIFDAMSKGEGGYRIMQTSSASAFNRVGFKDSETRNLSINQSMTLKTTESDVIVDNTLLTSDRLVFEYDLRQEFNGKINKETLFDTVSTRSFRDIFSTVNLFGAPESIEFLDLFYFKTCRDLKERSDKEISDFIVKNKVEMVDGEEYLEVNFSLDEEEFGEDDIIPSAVSGTLYYDKETGSFETFNYVIEFASESFNEETGETILVNMEYTCSGKASRESLGSMWTRDNPTVYDDVLTFLEKVREQVVPPTIY